MGRSGKMGERRVCLVIKTFAEDSSQRRCPGSWLHRGRKALVSTGIVRTACGRVEPKEAGEAVFDRCLAPALLARAIISSVLLGSLM